MLLKEYLKNLVEKVETQEDKGGKLGICITDDVMFTYHKDCFADWHEDFVIFYDKNSDVNMVIPYHSIKMFQYFYDEMIEKQVQKIGFEELLKKMLED